jgi:hypothetical protein
MKKKLRIISAFIAAFVMLFAATAVYADFGGFSGDSDFGGNWDSGSDSDWGSSYGDSGGGWFWSWGDTDYYDGGTREISCTTGDMMVFLFIVIVIVIIIWAMRSKMPGGTPVQTGVRPTDDSELTDISEYVRNVDPGFSVSKMQTKLNNLYVQLQKCWCDKDLEPLRPYLTDELFNQTERQLDDIRKAKQTPHVERISVLGDELRGYFQRDGMDHIIVELSTRITTYTTDDETGEVVRGNPNLEKFMTYEWDVCRTTGVKTGEADPMQVVNCPNCGAPVNVNMSARCPYCDSVITLFEHDWVLYSIKALSQRTQ